MPSGHKILNGFVVIRVHKFNYDCGGKVNVQLLFANMLANGNNNEFSSFPIMSNESFTFDYNDKLGVELEFKPRWEDGFEFELVDIYNFLYLQPHSSTCCCNPSNLF